MLQINDVFPDINPAFCSLVLASFCDGYLESSRCYPDYLSLLLVLPLVISDDLEHLFSNKQKKSDFFQIISQYPDVLMSFHDRIKGAFPITQEAMAFALHKGLFKLDTCMVFNLTERALENLRSKKISKRVRKYLSRANLLGFWLGKINSSETVMSYIGAV